MTVDLRLGLAVLNCNASGCRGVSTEFVVNAPVEGRPPRGFFVRPRGRRLDEVEVVVIGQNPGRAGAFERSMNQLLLEHPNRFNLMADAAISASAEESYYTRIDQLLDVLWPNGRQRVVLWAEVVYCESRIDLDPKKAPSCSWKEAVADCTSQHLKHQLAEVSEEATVICNGKIPADWFGQWSRSASFKGLWMRVPHSSGDRTFKTLFDGKSMSLSAKAKANWERLKRERRPIHLSTGDYLDI